MSNAIFPVLPGLEWNSVKAPIWNSRIQQSTGLYELRASYTALPLWKWTLSYEFLRQYGTLTEFATLVGFFNARQGKFDSFLYSDPNDNTIDAATPFQFATGDGVTHIFQLTRPIVAGGVVEPVYNLNGAPAIYKAGVLQSSGYSITNGAVNFTSAPAGGAALAWTGSYYWRVRFDMDSAEFTNFLNQYWLAKSISLMSIKGS